MSTPQQLAFVKWVKQTQPLVYQAAIAKVANKSRLGGLGDNLASDISFDYSDIGLSNEDQSAIDSAVSSSSTSSWGDGISSVIDSLSSAISSVAPAIVNTKAGLSAIQINQQRAAAGLPLITGASLVTGSTLASGDGLLIIGGIGLLAVLLAMGGKSKGK